jgi:hypothetical protein
MCCGLFDQEVLLFGRIRKLEGVHQGLECLSRCRGVGWSVAVVNAVAEGCENVQASLRSDLEVVTRLSGSVAAS